MTVAEPLDAETHVPQYLLTLGRTGVDKYWGTLFKSNAPDIVVSMKIITFVG